MSKLEMKDTGMDIVTKMSEGNPGALTVIMKFMNGDGIDIIKYILPLDTLEIYGSRLYMLWNDCCQRDDDKLKRVIDAYKFGKLSKESIIESIGWGRGTNIDI